MTIDASSDLFSQFARVEKLTEYQRSLFERYLQLLCQWNEHINLTTIIEPKSIITNHFRDSLALGHIQDLSTVQGIADIGSGAGFPGIALKIAYPHLSVVLIEVVRKKVNFLREVISTLALESIEVYDLDWRTFLRKTEYPVEFFCARASLAPDEMLRMFKPGCFYKDATLVYWASKLWEADPVVTPFLEKEVSYTLGSKTRKLVFFKKVSHDNP